MYPNHTSVKVAYVCRVIPHYRTHIFNALSSLSKFDISVFYGSDLPYPSKVKSGSAESFSFKHYKFPTLIFYFLKKPLLVHRGLLRKLFQDKPSILLVEGLSNILSFLKCLLYRLLCSNTKVIIWTLGGLPSSTLPAPFSTLFYKFFYSQADHIVTYSSFGRDYLVKHFSVSPLKVTVIVNISEVLPFNLAPTYDSLQILSDTQSLRLLYVGHLSEDKNILYLLSTFRSLLNNGYKLTLTVVGAGPLSFLFESEYSHPSINYLGTVPRHHLPSLYANSDLMVLPGRGGMVISEAMYCGLPVLLHAADGTEFDLVSQNKTGFYFDPHSSLYPNLYDTLCLLSRDRSLIKVVSKQAYSFVHDNYPSSYFCDSFSSLFDRLSL